MPHRLATAAGFVSCLITVAYVVDELQRPAGGRYTPWTALMIIGISISSNVFITQRAVAAYMPRKVMDEERLRMIIKETVGELITQAVDEVVGDVFRAGMVQGASRMARPYLVRNGD